MEQFLGDDISMRGSPENSHFLLTRHRSSAEAGLIDFNTSRGWPKRSSKAGMAYLSITPDSTD